MSQVLGALPPFAEAKREISAILNSSELSEFIPYGDVFESLIKTEDGYVITTNKRQIDVALYYSKNSLIGPSLFTIEFKD